ncbi:MAG: hypothetical protein ACJ73E_05670 [Mycobacteriales bacterium]
MDKLVSMNRSIGSAELLTEELKVVRRGPGLHHPGIDKRVGPALQAACGIDADDLPSVVRAKTIERLHRAAEALPTELSLSALVALGIHPEVHDLPRLQDRVGWLANIMKRDVRTARRRVDEACTRLADALSTSASARAGRRGPGWYVQSFHAVALLDGDRRVTVERRVIVAERDGLDHIQLGWSLPVQEGDGSGLDVRVLYGGVLAQREQQTATRLRLGLELPTPLRIGERHEYSVLTQHPPDLLMGNHYAYTPYTPCDFFDLRVRFERKRVPDRIWRVSEAFHRDLDERHVVGDPLSADASGDVHIQFDDLVPGLGYGIQWS